MGDDVTTVWLTVNGDRRRAVVEHRTSLLSLLRDEWGLTGTKRGCNRGQCGACTVLIDQRPRYACLVLAALAAGSSVRTVEGLAVDGQLSDLQEAFLDRRGYQCGFCTPGMLMSATALLAEHKPVTDAAVRTALAGNVCRCGNYANIVSAVQAAASKRGH